MSTINKKIEEQRFEFVLYINKHIICQRYFSIRDYNETSVNSYELKELMDKIMGMNNGDYGSMGLIPKSLKKKAIDILWKNYNQYAPRNESFKDNTEKEEFFEFEILVDKNVIAKSGFGIRNFPQQVKYQVDIKDLIPQIITEIKDGLSQKKYTTKYTNVVL